MSDTEGNIEDPNGQLDEEEEPVNDNEAIIEELNEMINEEMAEEEQDGEEKEVEEDEEGDQQTTGQNSEKRKTEITFDDSGMDGTTPLTTIFESMYEPTILEPWRDSKPLTSSSLLGRRQSKTAKDASVRLTDRNAKEFGNVSRVGWKGRIDYALQEYDEEKGRKLATQSDIANDPNKLLSIATSTIILMAKKSKKIPKENFMYTELYLKSITDEYGDHPPNIKNLLKHIQYLKRKCNIDWGTKIETEVPKKLVVAKINKQSRIPVRVKKNDESQRQNGGMENAPLTSNQYSRPNSGHKRHLLAFRVKQNLESK